MIRPLIEGKPGRFGGDFPGNAAFAPSVKNPLVGDRLGYFPARDIVTFGRQPKADKSVLDRVSRMYRQFQDLSRLGGQALAVGAAVLWPTEKSVGRAQCRMVMPPVNAADNTDKLRADIHGTLAESQLTLPDGGKLQVFHIPAQPGQPTILGSYFNGGNAVDLLRMLGTFTRKGIGVAVYDYPGYGKSDGRPSEDKLYQAAEAVSERLVSLGVPVTEQILLGHSLGTAVTVDLARKRPFRHVYLLAPFTNLGATLKERIAPWAGSRLAGLVEKRFQHVFASDLKMQSIRAPLTIFHGGKDAITPSDMGQRLHDLATRSVAREFVLLAERDHGTVLLGGLSRILKALKATLQAA